MTRASRALPSADKLFREGWTRSRGRLGAARLRGTSLGPQRHMARAAAGSRAAVFKLIARGGCRTTQQLHGQLEYLLGKADAVLDSRGLYESDGPLSSEDALAAAERWAQDWQGTTRTGHTSHMVMSFPAGTDPAAVRAISERFCERFFDGRYDTIAAVHTDRLHPHTHIVVNRRGFDGELFTLRAGTDYSYGAFKDAMVEIGAEHGVAMEASHRLERGIVARAPTDAQYRAGATVAIPREGEDLAYAVGQVAKHGATYRALAAEARIMVRSDLAGLTRGQAVSQGDLAGMAEALERAAAALSAEEPLSAAAGPLPLDQQARFHEALRGLDVATQQVVARIAAAPPAARPTMEAQLDAVLVEASRLDPHGSQAAELAQPASADGLYARQNLVTLRAGDVLRLERALEGTGIDPEVVAARLRVGAPNAALERLWVGDDLHAVARARGLDMTDQRQFEAVLANVDRVHDRVAGVVGISDEVAAAGEGIADHATQVKVPAHRAQAHEDRASDAAEAHEQTRAERAREAAEAQEAAAQSAARTRDAAKSGLVRLAAPVGETDRRRYRAAVEGCLTRDELACLQRGDASGLDGAGTAEDQFAIAREYLKAGSHSPEALRQVTKALHEAHEIAQAERGPDDGIEH